MNNQVANIINSIEKKEKYNILTFDTHERYQSQMAKTGHNFYSFRYENCKKWRDDFAVKPDNYYTLPDNAIYGGLDFDFILAQSRFGQIQVAANLQKILSLPVILLEHTLPIKEWPNEYKSHMRLLQGNINVFISEYSKQQWGLNGNVIKHAIDTDVFSPSNNEKEQIVLSVVNDYINRDYCCNYSGWTRITKDMPVKLVGDTPGLSKAASSIEELVGAYNKCAVFLNTSTVSPVPMSLLEAMACGCAVVSTATCMIPEIIENGVNGFISNDESELRNYVQLLLNDKELAKKMGDKARETILKDFSSSRFTKEWNRVFDLAYRLKGVSE